MLEKLKKRWKVNGINLALIITTFALGGSLCGYAGRKLILLMHLEKGITWVIVYILLITFLWPLAVLLISIPLGQFGFFKKYVGKIGKDLLPGRGQQKGITRIAIFASGAGSNAQQLINHFAGSATAEIALIACNKPGAGVLSIAQKENIPVLLISKEKFFNGDAYLPVLLEKQINFIVLAGFLWKMPAQLIRAYPKKIINIHPALLPKYGGKGMYGHHVHEAVISNKEKESGISIHYVDEIYDHGDIIFQAKCPVEENDTPESLAQKVHQLEHLHYPVITGDILKKQNRS
jgi:formyltetrahydrofolate-dependent phosphoribosylglycinamide formyltransferase